MDLYRTMGVFAEVARCESFAGAARALHISTSAVSRQVMELEDWLGCQLLQRTTRRLSLTDDGRAHLARCQSMLEDVRELRERALQQHHEPRGVLRVTAPLYLGRTFVGACLPSYLAAHPQVEVELVLLDRYVDMVGEGFDLALRVGDLPDSSLVARRLWDVRLQLTASPDYLARHGTPQHPSELAQHNCLVDQLSDSINLWHFGGRQRVAARGNLRVNNGELVREMTLAGLGISLLPDIFVARDIAAGRLLPLLASHLEDRTIPLSAIYPHGRHLSSRVRSFVDHLLAHSDQLSALYAPAAPEV